jgi:hypothetical protein
MRRQLLLVLPALTGGLAMAWSIHLSYFLRDPGAASLVWAVVLLGPFIFVGVVAWRSRRGFIPAVIVVFPALLLAAAPFACFTEGFGEGCQYFLVLSPIYLWVVVAVAALLEIGTRHRSSPGAA